MSSCTGLPSSTYTGVEFTHLKTSNDITVAIKDLKAKIVTNEEQVEGYRWRKHAFRNDESVTAAKDRAYLNSLIEEKEEELNQIRAGVSTLEAKLAKLENEDDQKRKAKQRLAEKALSSKRSTFSHPASAVLLEPSMPSGSDAEYEEQRAEDSIGSLIFEEGLRGSSASIGW